MTRAVSLHHEGRFFQIRDESGMFGIGFDLPFTHKWTNPEIKCPGLIASLEILNPESKVR